jgi:hypothetical protein
MAAIVQFIHPGPEPGPDARDRGLCPWNTGKHRRKFLRSGGAYVEKGIRKEGELCFWGEWEPPSRVAALPVPARRYPRWLHTPYLPIGCQDLVNEQYESAATPGDCGAPASCAASCAGHWQNTDPFVFGSRFLYGHCGQTRNGRPSFMARLSPGSLVLFGTRYKDDRGFAFHLDTVFVVENFVPYNTGHLDDFVPATESEAVYKDLSLRLTWPAKTAAHICLRLYRGAVFKEGGENMYSFSPARVYDPSRPGASAFSPVIIDGLPYINAGQTTGFNANGGRTDFSIAEVTKLWKRIRAQCRAVGCVEGLSFDIPEREETERRVCGYATLRWPYSYRT